MNLPLNNFTYYDVEEVLISCQSPRRMHRFYFGFLACWHPLHDLSCHEGMTRLATTVFGNALISYFSRIRQVYKNVFYNQLSHQLQCAKSKTILTVGLFYLVASYMKPFYSHFEASLLYMSDITHVNETDNCNLYFQRRYQNCYSP